MLFKNRQEAGKKLALALMEYEGHSNTLLIALPRGGVVVGYEVAKVLSLPLDIMCPRKIGAPFNEELAIGAITETGEGILSQELIQELGISENYLKQAIEKEKKEAKWRLDHFRQNRPPRNLAEKTIILIDDGLATGSTMRAAIKTAKAEKVAKIIVAIPVAPFDSLARIEKEVSKVVCLASPRAFLAVGQFYEDFKQTTDEEVISLLAKAL